MQGQQKQQFSASGSSSSTVSAIRQNYTDEVEAGVNKQINIELYASYVYLSMVGRVIACSSLNQ